MFDSCFWSHILKYLSIGHFFFLKGHLLALSGIIDGEYQDRFTVNDSSGFHIMGLRKASICWTHDKLGMRLP